MASTSPVWLSNITSPADPSPYAPSPPTVAAPAPATTDAIMACRSADGAKLWTPVKQVPVWQVRLRLMSIASMITATSANRTAITDNHSVICPVFAIAPRQVTLIYHRPWFTNIHSHSQRH